MKVAVKVVEARNVPKMDTGGSSDPYMKVTLRDQKFQTKPVSNTTEPKWNEEFEFRVFSYETDEVVFEMWDKDIACDDAISFTEVKIAKVKPGVIVDSWYNFTPSGPKIGGEVHIVIHVMRSADTKWCERPFHPSLLKLTVVAARGLPDMDSVGHSDPYLLFGLKNSSRRERTKTIDNTENPTWNESATFLLTDPDGDFLEFLIRDADVSKDDDMGSCVVPVGKFGRGGIVTDWFALTPAKGVKKGGELQLSGQIVAAPGY